MTMTQPKVQAGPYKVGDTLTLVHKEYVHNAYVDALGFPHKGNVVQEVVLARIVEQREVPGCYGPNDRFIGYRAASLDGKRSFECNWSNLDETSGAPYATWFENGGRPVVFEEAVYTMCWSIAFPLVTKEGKLPELPGVVRCDKHKHPKYHRSDEECFYCKHLL